LLRELVHCAQQVSGADRAFDLREAGVPNPFVSPARVAAQREPLRRAMRDRRTASPQLMMKNASRLTGFACQLRISQQRRAGASPSRSKS
jgi:hypothetical protein